ncbi:MAG: hypothetical protein LBB89_07005 [Treponema sp.]|jgi:hypothetical protein|nr:hypothetical protein [Treponema sp.]
MKNFCKVLFFGIIFTGAAGTGFTQIDRGELQKNLAPVSFTNYEGPHARIETREQIRQIGVGLGQAVKAGAERTGANSRYFVIHSVSAPDGTKLDADIFGLGANTGVDHIRNLRTIIQGYLQEAYSYSAQDAAVLAEYITIYNAVYRGNWDYFSERYKKPVLGHLNPQQVGLATRYSEWPGKTLMLIPLGMGGISSIDTSSISDSRVVEEMRREDDRGIEQRRGMVDIKEREAEAAEQKAVNQREAVRREERAIAEEKSQLEKDRQQQAENPPASRAEAAQQESEAQKKSDELDQRESELVLQREEAAKQEQFAEKKTEEAQRERESIARDQQAIIDRGETPQGLIGIILERTDTALGRLVAIDPATRRELRRSPLDTVYARTLTFVGGKILAIAGENRDNGAVRLIEINSRMLTMVKQGNDDLHPNSLIWVNGNDIYAITADLTNGTLNLGRFNADLALQAKSKIAVHPNAAVSIQQGSLLIQRADGSVALLNSADLTEQ